MRTLRLRASLALSGVMALGGCAAEPLEPGGVEAEEASIRVAANVANTPIDLLVVTVSAADLPIPGVFNLPVANGTASGTIRIPAGTARSFTVEAFDDNGDVTHDGTATRDVQPGQNPPLTIPLTPRSGHVPLTIIFGDFSVEVLPASQVLNLALATTVQLTVTVVDGEGMPVDAPDVVWATTNPALATVSPSGLVTALLPGEVDVVATYNGIAGVSHLSIFGTAPDLYYADMDADGFGDPESPLPVPAGSPPPEGYVADNSDCEDASPATFPGAPEVLDGNDNDCDTVVDEGIAVDVFADADADGWGDPAAPLTVFTGPDYLVELPPGYAIDPLDCDDTNASISPSAPEIAGDLVDDNCNGLLDE